jgi:hypothetical protein
MRFVLCWGLLPAVHPVDSFLVLVPGSWFLVLEGSEGCEKILVWIAALDSRDSCWLWTGQAGSWVALTLLCCTDTAEWWL